MKELSIYDGNPVVGSSFEQSPSHWPSFHLSRISGQRYKRVRFRLIDAYGMSDKIRVAVVGAGPSGLAALRNLSKDLDTFEPVAFEKGDAVGGVWLYQESPELDEDGFCNTLYENLRTNLPKEVMDFPDMSYPRDLPSFMHHKHVGEYCQNYAKKWNLHRFIKFHTKVVLVKPVSDTKPVKWLIEVEDTYRDEVTSDQYDAVMVCNGHLSKPYVPSIPGSDLFQGHVIHSRQYRLPDGYKGQKVICVGGSFSGIDIMGEICTTADKVYLSHDRLHSMEIPNNAEQVPRISSMGPDYVILQDGRRLPVDAVVYCTGYQYDFRFLSPECGIVVKDERVRPLYKHVFNIRHPSMTFIGILKRVLLNRCAYMQSEAVCSVLRGERRLPDEEDMLADEERQLRMLPPDVAPHDLFGDMEIAYYEDMRQSFGIELWPDGVRAIYDRVVYELIAKDATFKDINFILSEDKRSYVELPKDASLTNGCESPELIPNGDINGKI